MVSFKSWMGSVAPAPETSETSSDVLGSRPAIIVSNTPFTYRVGPSISIMDIGGHRWVARGSDHYSCRRCGLTEHDDGAGQPCEARNG